MQYCQVAHANIDGESDFTSHLTSIFLSVETDSLVCAAPAQAATTGSDAGGRGLKYEVWISTEGEGESPADTLSTDAADYRQTVLDGSRCKFGWLVWMLQLFSC